MTLGEIMWEATLIGLWLIALGGFLWLCGAIVTQLWLIRKQRRAYDEMMEIDEEYVEGLVVWCRSDARRATAGLVVDDPEPPIMTLTPERLAMISRALTT